jgi:hypothetical protein
LQFGANVRLSKIGPQRKLNVCSCFHLKTDKLAANTMTAVGRDLGYEHKFNCIRIRGIGPIRSAELLAEGISNHADDTRPWSVSAPILAQLTCAGATLAIHGQARIGAECCGSGYKRRLHGEANGNGIRILP